MALRPCLECSTPTDASYCRAHRRPIVRNHADEKQRRHILDHWRAAHGEWCAGAPELDHPAHEAHDLTVDHIKAQARGGSLADGWRVVCRSANSSRGAGQNFIG